MTWVGFAGVFGLFFASHSIPVRPRVRTKLVSHLGPRGFTIAYSALSILMLAILIGAAGNAPYVQLWSQAIWQHYVVTAGMLGVCIILALSLGRPNPFSFGGMRNHEFDPRQPGIVRVTRHPVLAALALWAALHLLPNGDLAHVLLFGVFAAFAGLGHKIIDKRKKREMGRDVWMKLWAEVKNRSHAKPWAIGAGSIKRLFYAFAACAALLVLHPLVIGVRVF